MNRLSDLITVMDSLFVVMTGSINERGCKEL